MQFQAISTVEKVLLFCYNYDPQSQKYVLLAINIMKVGGILTLLFLIGLGIYVTKGRK